MKGYNDFSVIQPQTETVTSFGIVIQGDTSGLVAKGVVKSAGDNTNLKDGQTVFYFKNTAVVMGVGDLVVVEQKNIVACEDL